MRIALIVYGDINSLSGGYLYDRKLLEYLQSQNEEVEIISLPNPGYLKALLNMRIPDELLNKQFDILLQDELVHPSMVWTNKKIKKRYDCPLVSLVHLFNSSRPLSRCQKILLRFVERNYLKSIDALILNSQNTLRQAENLLGENLPAHIVATPCGDNFGEVNTVKLRGDAERIRLLYVGNLIHQKGLHVLLQALEGLKKVEWVLTVVGRSELEPNYANQQQKFAREHGLSERVSFIGALGSEALARVYREHDLFIMPSVNEAYGIVYLEAMQFGLPVIGTNTGGGMEIIENEHNGFLIEPGDHKALAAIIRDLAAHPERLSQLSQQARQSYFSHPRWQDSCQSIHEFLKQLQGNRLNRED